MKPINELLDHLLKLKIFPDERLVDDGRYHIFTDASSGRKYEYCVFKNRTYDVYPVLKYSLMDDEYMSEENAA